jgi:hypothetical protein
LVCFKESFSQPPIKVWKKITTLVATCEERPPLEEKHVFVTSLCD